MSEFLRLVFLLGVVIALLSFLTDIGLRIIGLRPGLRTDPGIRLFFNDVTLASFGCLLTCVLVPTGVWVCNPFLPLKRKLRLFFIRKLSVFDEERDEFRLKRLLSPMNHDKKKHDLKKKHKTPEKKL